MGGLAQIWFVVEIMFTGAPLASPDVGITIIAGMGGSNPLIYSRHHTVASRIDLLICGILSSLWYVAINTSSYTLRGYSVVTQTVSELSAINAPTRIFWVLLVIWYPILFASFG
jgi:hypothetical protein